MQKTPSKNWFEEFTVKCRRYNLKVTPQRIAIYREIIVSKMHPTADEIYRSVKNEYPNISFDTVNRTLLTFAQIRIIDIVESYSGARRFDPNTEDHHHLHCIKCGKIMDFIHEKYDSLEMPECLPENFRIINRRVVLNGICRRCQITE
ncbi:transcriptional repressor [candidate division KSB1 bacterium]|nr:transcriptional repressor [candidate division KSB1 bacterium]